MAAPGLIARICGIFGFRIVSDLNVYSLDSDSALLIEASNAVPAPTERTASRTGRTRPQHRATPRVPALVPV